jgi:hypothetical protein
MKKSLISAIVLATASFGSSVMAAPISSPPRPLALTDNTAFFGDTFAASNNGNNFADRFTFTVTGTTRQNLDAIVSSISRTADVGLDITGLQLYDGNDTLLFNGTSMGGSNKAVDVWTVSGNNLAAGDYYIRVNGDMVSATGASFGGAVMLAPVPEPETYGMMLGGLGVLGFLARRRKAKQG